MYTRIVFEHFLDPVNVGQIENPDGESRQASGECGDLLVLHIKVNEAEIIEDIKYQIKGCVAAIATSSITSELALGKHIDDALKINERKIVNALGGLPEEKLHCSILAAKALHEAINNYLSKMQSTSSTIVE